MLNNTVTYLRSHIKMIVFGVLVLLGALYFGYKMIWGSATEMRYVLSKVERGILISSVTGTGQVSTLNKVDLKPLGSGTLIAVNAQNGDSVYTGRIIAIMDQRSAQISLSQARANLESVTASYNKIESGATIADIRVSQVSVLSASSTLINAQQALVDKLNIAYTTAFQNVLNSTNVFFTNPTLEPPQLLIPNFSITNSQLGINVSTERGAINHNFSVWKSDLALITNSSDLSTINSESTQNLATIGKYLDDLQLLLSTGVVGDSRYQTTLDGYIASVTSARGSISSTNTSLISMQQSVATAQISLAQARASYDLKVQSARPEDLAVAMASVHNAQANLQTAQNNYENNIIRAPFDGVLANLSVHVGDWVSSGAASGSGSSIGSVLTKQEIAQIPMNEVDVAKIKIANKVVLSFDAIPGLTISGSIVDIDSLGTVTSGVVTYSVKIKFDTQDSRVKPGMSVSASIITGTKTDTLLVPNSAIKSKGGAKIVQVFDQVMSEDTSGSGVISKTLPRERVVTVGVANDSSTEIISGLSEGDRVVIKTLTSNATKTAAAPSLLQATGAGGKGSGGSGNTTRTTTRGN